MLGAGPSVTLPAPSDGDVAARVRRVRLHPAPAGPLLRATPRLHRQEDVQPSPSTHPSPTPCREPTAASYVVHVAGFVDDAYQPLSALTGALRAS